MSNSEKCSRCSKQREAGVPWHGVLGICWDCLKPEETNDPFDTKELRKQIEETEKRIESALAELDRLSKGRK